MWMQECDSLVIILNVEKWSALIVLGQLGANLEDADCPAARFDSPLQRAMKGRLVSLFYVECGKLSSRPLTTC